MTTQFFIIITYTLTEKSDLASALEARLQAIEAGTCQQARVFIGFDGFTDEIIHAVETRQGGTFTPFALISAFAERIRNAAGKSTNIELVVSQKKLGGNAAIMASALSHAGHAITFVGNIGLPGKIEPLFADLAAKSVRIVPLGPSAHSDAVEFEDGKIILGKLDALDHINYDAILSALPKKELTTLLDETDLFVSANWTMLPMMTGLWVRIKDEIVPAFRQKKKRTLFVDLADPAKRSDEDLIAALQALANLQGAFDILLGLNEAEAERVLAALGKSAKKEPAALAAAIREASHLHRIVVHATHTAASASPDGVHLVTGPDIGRPKLSTGGGDNFNAGFATALLYNLPDPLCLLAGVATSGYYVSHGKSPTIPELTAFLRAWDARLADN